MRTAGSAWWYALPAVLIGVAYAGGLDGGFVSDDWPMIAENPHLRTADAIPGFFTAGAWHSTGLENVDGGPYRPLYLLWYFALYQGFGAAPVAFHAAHLALHGIDTALVALLLGVLAPHAGHGARALGASLFAVHPVQSEPVAWIAAGTDLLLGMFFLAAVLAWLRSRDDGGPVWRAGALAAFALALLSKETAVVLPAVLVLLDRLRAASWRALPWRAYLPFVVVLAAYLALRAAALAGEGEAERLSLSVDGFARLGTYYLLALRHALISWPLPFWFARPESGIGGAPDLLVGAAGLVALALYARRGGVHAVPLAWITLTVLPPLGLAFHASGAFALRFLYLPMAGWALLVVLLAADLRGGLKAAMAAALLALALLCQVGVSDWRDEARFYRKVLRFDDASAGGWEGLARHHQRSGDVEAAAAAFADGLARVRAPAARAALADGLGYSQGQLGRYRESIAAYRIALEHDPDRVGALVGLGNDHWLLGETGAAIGYYHRALAVAPAHFEATFNIARLSEASGDVAAAARFYRRVLEIATPGSPAAAVARARAFLAGSGGRGVRP